MGLREPGPGGPLVIAGGRLGPGEFNLAENNMPETWQKIKVYTKLIFICVVILAALVFIVSNGRLVTISLGWWKLAEIRTWLLIVLAGVAGIVVFLAVGRISSLLQDFRRLRGKANKRKQNLAKADSPFEQ